LKSSYTNVNVATALAAKNVSHGKLVL